MYSQQLLRAHHDEWLRYAQTCRMVKQASAEARQTARPRPGMHRLHALFGGLTLRRPVRPA